MKPLLIITRGSEWGGPLVGCRLKFSNFVGSQNCVASLCPSSAFEILKTSSEQFVRRILKASPLSNRRFNNWCVIRGEIVYTVRFPFQMRLYVKDSFFSFFR